VKLLNNRIFISIFLLLISFAVYAPSLKSGFVWDDFLQLKSKNLKFTEEGKEFSLFPDINPERAKNIHFRPLLKLSWSIDNLLWGKSPFGFHLTNIILNSITVLFFYFLAFLILSEFEVKSKEGIAFVGSLFFALFPVHVEAVSWISARGDLLSTSFFLLGLIFHILSYKYGGYRNIAIFLLAVLSFYLALASKEIAVAFPLIAILFDLLHRRIATRGSILRNSVYLLVLLLYLYLRSTRFIVEPIVDNQIGQGSVSSDLQIWDILETLFQTYFFYFKKLVFPFNLNPYIHILPAGITNLLSSILIILIMIVIGFVSFLKKENITAFGTFWILINLGPPSLIAVMSIGQTPLAERFMYLPSRVLCQVIYKSGTY